ncbi:MAG: glycosyltransferase [candidate division Zixibacteria bacterium]|nr:glycosyltransferase [candidate division Zixibacteria bacterium]
MANKRLVIFGWAQSVHIQRWVSGLQARGFEIKLISLGGEKLPDTETVIYPYGPRIEYLKHTGDAAREARAFRPDLVHVHYAGGFGLWGLRAHIKPTVVSIWGSDLNEFSRHWYTRFLLGLILGNASAITVTGGYLKGATVALFPDIESKLHVVPFGVELPNEVPPMPTNVKICYIKAHRPVYGPDILIDAMAEVKKTIPDIRLSMAGRGEMTAKIQEQIVSHGLEDNIKLVGFIENQWMYHFISEHNIVVMPSRRESFGVAALEASACGRPVIASNVGGIPEVVLNNLTGVLVPPEDPAALAEAIIRLVQDRASQQQMGEAGQRYVMANYTWEKSLDLMATLYERVLHVSGK